MSELNQIETTRPHWWGLFVPRGSPNCSVLSRVMSAIVYLLVMLIGSFLAVGMLVLTPLTAMVVAAIESLRGRKPATQTTSLSDSHRS